MSEELLSRREFVGRVEWIGIAPARRDSLQTPPTVQVVPGGIVGEHHFDDTKRSHRQVTLIQHEHFDSIARLLGRDTINPGDLRRNIVVSGINLASLKERRFSIGDAILVGSGDCDPCRLMEETVGPGAYAAMTGHGGITATVEKAGDIAIGSEIRAEKSTNV